MKKNFALFGLILLVFSLYSASALTNGTLYASVGESVTFGVGDAPSINVTNNSGSSSNEGTTTGGGGGGGASGGGSGNLKTISSSSGDFCSENWQCSEWSSCENGIQTRTCSDINECGTETNKPATEQECETTTSSNFLTAAVIGVSDFAKTPYGVATFIVVGLMIVGGITFLAVKGKFKNLIPKKKENNISEQ